MNAAPQDDLTMAGHAKMLARSAAALAKELPKPYPPWATPRETASTASSATAMWLNVNLASLVAQLADVVAELAALTPCDDRTCTTRSHWAVGRINHGDTPTTCTHGQDHPDTLACEYACSATTAGHMCGRREHPGDRCHQWTMTDEEYDRRREEAGVPRDVFDDVRAWADGREAAQRRLTAGCGDRGGECGQLDGSGAAVGSDRHVAPAKCALSEPHQGPHLWVDVVARSLETGEYVPMSVTARKEADPLDEDDHRPRHFADGEHLRRYACGHWHMATRDRCNEPDHGDGYTLVWWDEPLTFCDCP